MSITKLVKMAVMGDAPQMAEPINSLAVSVNICLFYRSNGTAVAGRYMKTGDLHEPVAFDGTVIPNVVRYLECPSITCEHSDVLAVRIDWGKLVDTRIHSEVAVEPLDFVLQDDDCDQTEFRSSNPERNHGPVDGEELREGKNLAEEMIAHCEFMQIHC